MQLRMHPMAGQQSGDIEVSDAVFAVQYNEALVSQVLTSYMAGARAGTKAQKTRSAVRGGGRKPWRQKGTGRARAGTRSSPLWRGGGVTFAASPREYGQKINKKMYRGAVRAILSELIRQDRLICVESFVVDVPKTKAVLEKIQLLGVTELLIVTDELSTDLLLGARNIPRIDVITVEEVNPYSLIGFEHVLMTRAVLTKLEASLL